MCHVCYDRASESQVKVEALPVPCTKKCLSLGSAEHVRDYPLVLVPVFLTVGLSHIGGEDHWPPGSVVLWPPVCRQQRISYLVET